MKFLVIFALCIGAALAEVPELPEIFEDPIVVPDVPVVPEDTPVQHEQELAELCKERGVFANPHDPEHRTFIRCELEPVELQCDEGFLFSEEKLMCVEKPQPAAPVNLDAVNWREVLTCDPAVEDKYFRNPYDCSKFYRCYTQGEFKRMDPMTCLPTMIFDEALETCLPIDQFKSLYGVECNNAPLPEQAKPEEPIPEPEPEQPEQPEEPLPEPEETIPEEPLPEKTPEETLPEETLPEETLPEEPIPEIPEEPLPEQPEEPEKTIPEEPIPEIPEEPLPEKNEEPIPEIPEEPLPEQPEEPIPEQPEEPLPEPEETIPEEPLPEQPEETVPEETIPEEAVPEQKEKPNLNEILKQIKDLFGNGM